MAVAIERVLRQFWLPGITSITGKQQRGLQAFLLDDRYRVYAFPTANFFEITPLDSNEIKHAICHDLSRMACAAFESVYAVQPPAGLEKSSGWGVIRSYYAAFFAIHAIVRIFGTTCTQLDVQHIQYISKVTSYTHAETVKHSGGLYCGKWDDVNGVLRFSKPTENTHEATWKIFLDLLIELRDSLLNGSSIGLVVDLQNTALELDSLRKALCENGFNLGNWLSNIRNRVNYRHDFDAWFPYGKPKNHYHSIWNGADERWLKSPMPIKTIPIHGRELEKMIELSGAIVSLCRCFIEHISETCVKKESFVKYGPYSIIELLRNR